METTVKRSETIAALSAALAEAQAEMRNPPKDSVNPHFKSRYADLATVRDTVLPVLNKHGLSVLQLPCERDGGPALTSLLLHKSGEWVETTLALRAQQNTPQGIGSALTYCRRYALQSLAGVAADDDDDGNASNAPARPRPAPSAARSTEPPKPQPDADGIDRSADRAVKAAREQQTGDPISDGNALRALAERKGWDWPRIVASLNDKFKTKYTQLTPWGDVAKPHREATVKVLKALPDRDSVDELIRLVSQVATAEKASAAAVFQRYQVAAKLPESCIEPKDLSPAQLPVACKAFRAKLDALANADEADDAEGGE